MWDDAAESHLRDIASNCDSCRAADPVRPMRKVSISGLSSPFNRELQIGHMFLGGNPIFHMVQHPHLFSIGVPVSTRTVTEAISCIESRWFTDFWAPQYMFDLIWHLTRMNFTTF